jgi:serine/threonine protein kinase
LSFLDLCHLTYNGDQFKRLSLQRAIVRLEDVSMIGTTLSHYQIIEKLGQGGMGEVFLAQDTSLDRKVALKFLPDIFSGDPERLARFEREAKMLASLNHPNIAAIHGLELAEGKRFLVMELVEGETLAQRIAQGPLPVDEALEVWRQIAEGLEAAHEKGIIHRDLKPANVKITPEGKVKILDFGLAKAFQGETLAADASKSPTLTDQMTRPGVILGTAAYIAPEQAKGKPADKRADIWALGCVLYECLTGKRAFQGDTVTETMATILTKEPEWKSLPAATPRRIRSLLRHCLQKDPRLRLHDIADGRIEIEEVAAEPDSLSMPSAALGFTAAAYWHRVVSWILCGGLVLVVGILLLRPSRQKELGLRPLIRLNISLPESAPLVYRIRSSVAYDYGLAISRDGAFIVYLAGRGAGG